MYIFATLGILKTPSDKLLDMKFLIFKKVGRCENVRLFLCKRIKMSPHVMFCSLKNASLHICIVYSYTKDPAMVNFLVTPFYSPRGKVTNFII